MSNIASPLAQELLSGHVLMMQCGASAVRILDRVHSADARPFDLRAGDEAVRMAGLSARLMRYHTTGVQLLHRLPPAARASLAPAVQTASGAEAKTPTSIRKLHADPGASRGRLKNGNPSGDYLKSPRCGARTRAGGCCRQPAMASPGGGRGRCRMHGGLSTGPRTLEGLARCRATRLVHGYRTRAHIALRSRAAHAARRLRDLTAGLRASSAGHGVHRSVSVTGSRAAAGRAGLKPAPTKASAPVISAGHGVHRSVFGGQMTDDGGQKVSRPTAALKPSTLDVPPGTFCLPSSVVCPPPAGHGLHRSIRDHLRSSACIGGFKSFPPVPAAPMRNFVLRSGGALR